MALETLGKDSLFDLILMDMSMPDLDGIEATRCVRELGHDIPIVILTGSTDLEDKEACFRAGANGLYNKPVPPEKVFEVLQTFAGQGTGQ